MVSLTRTIRTWIRKVKNIPGFFGIPGQGTPFFFKHPAHNDWYLTFPLLNTVSIKVFILPPAYTLAHTEYSSQKEAVKICISFSLRSLQIPHFVTSSSSNRAITFTFGRIPRKRCKNHYLAPTSIYGMPFNKNKTIETLNGSVNIIIDHCHNRNGTSSRIV